MKILKNKGGYSIIFILLIIGFLLFLGVGIFNLILNDLKDNKAIGNYIKSYAGAESASELALLQIKKNGYAYYDKIEHNVSNRSIILADNPLDTNNFKPSNDVFISYDIGSKVNEYNGSLKPLEYDIIPLFYLNDEGEQKINKLDFSILTGNPGDLAWNVIGKTSGISGTGTNILGSEKELTINGLQYREVNINDFISKSDENYIVMFNSGNSGDITYNIKSQDTSEFFSKPKTSIVSSAQVGNYKQNLSVDLNNTEFLNILKYSIFSN
ncbi:MAG: hypothetical protein PHS49_04455 [Candidatus Gracilibacteria bacterium]|nr:hypothetical protein [Candidatus Gracilibacteria bacterium]